MDAYFSNIKTGNYDSHIHSCYSRDSDLSCFRILDIAQKLRLKLIAVTDHNTIKGGVKTWELAKDLDLDIRVLIGSEIKTESGAEIIGLGLKEEIKSRKLDFVIKEIKKQGGLVVIPHPSRWNKRRINIPRIKNYVDYIEVYNGRNLFSLSNWKALKLANKFNIKSIKGSDAHFGFEIGNNKKKFINWRGFLGFFMTAVFKFIYTIKKITILS